MREISSFRRAGGSALRALADTFGEEWRPSADPEASVDATIIFADIESFSDLVAREGDDVASRVLDALDHAVDAALEGTRCRVVKRLGDGVMLAADDPGDGVSAAVALPGRFSEQLAGESFSLRLRVGAHRGVVRPRGGDVIGHNVNVAARVAEQATGGTTLVTAALLDSVVLADGLHVADAGHLVAKGVPERPALHAITLVRSGPDGSRPHSQDATFG